MAHNMAHDRHGTYWVQDNRKSLYDMTCVPVGTGDALGASTGLLSLTAAAAAATALLLLLAVPLVLAAPFFGVAVLDVCTGDAVTDDAAVVVVAVAD